jgi:putative sterol carrier protein
MSEPTIKEFIMGHEVAFQPDNAVGVDAIIQYHLSGEEGGDWIIAIKDGTCKVTEGIAENPKMTLNANAQDFKNILLGKQDGMAAFMQGKLKVSGDFGLAMRYMNFFKI